MNDELREAIVEWQEFRQKQRNADDHTTCPICYEQLYFCGCSQEMAQDILSDHATDILEAIRER